MATETVQKINEELLDALYDLLDAIPTQGVWWPDHLIDAVKKAKAVIEKAEQ